MKNRLLQTIALLITVLLPTAVHPEPMDVSYSYGLESYISKVCPKDCVNGHEIMESVVPVADKYNLDFRLLLAIIRVESAFKPKVKNMSNVGLMQINLRYHRTKFDLKDFTDPKQNVKVGGIVLSDCLKKHKYVIEKGLRCYNGWHKGDPKYVSKVLAALREISRITF